VEATPQHRAGQQQREQRNESHGFGPLRRCHGDDDQRERDGLDRDTQDVAARHPGQGLAIGQVQAREFRHHPVHLGTGREWRDALQAALALAGAERLHQQLAEPQGFAQRTGSKQSELNAALRDDDFAAGEQAALAPQAFAFGQQAKAPIPNVVRTMPLTTPSASASRRTAAIAPRVKRFPFSSTKPSRRPGSLMSNGMSGSNVCKQAEQTGHPDQREVEQAGGKHADRVHREDRSARGLGRCRSGLRAVGALGHAGLAGADRAAEAVGLVQRDAVQYAFGLAARTGFDLHLGQAEQAVQRPALDIDVLDAIERNRTAVAAEQAAFDHDLARAHAVTEAAPGDPLHQGEDRSRAGR
jgi:hypothetical protein